MILDETFMPVGTRPSPASDAATLQVGAIQTRSHVAGPGVRSVVWVAGCHRRCPGCLKPDLFDFRVGERMEVEALFQRLATVDGVTGVTFSGGEPFEQPAALAALASRLHGNGRDVLVYTGYRHEDLQRDGDAGIRRLLAETDILVDGEYRADLVNPGRWRGSANQRIIPLTETGRRLVAVAAAAPALEEIQVSCDGSRVRVSGCPDRGFFSVWTAELARREVVVAPGAGSDIE
jgi:anaerobic ribonucleoside-triphosphate reductase activating protein